ncbi:hypothetical protein BHE74_00030652 [Ensete ventricosum]|nr:hypothetical protein BHE74_00030652 [Ensete ventricosum]RZS07915.1 hypothetical protein BHM03_00038836 [Ensete ventricosum]
MRSVLLISLSPTLHRLAFMLMLMQLLSENYIGIDADDSGSYDIYNEDGSLIIIDSLGRSQHRPEGEVDRALVAPPIVVSISEPSLTQWPFSHSTSASVST